MAMAFNKFIVHTFALIRFLSTPYDLSIYTQSPFLIYYLYYISIGKDMENAHSSRYCLIYKICIQMYGIHILCTPNQMAEKQNNKKGLDFECAHALE